MAVLADATDQNSLPARAQGFAPLLGTHLESDKVRYERLEAHSGSSAPVPG